MKITPETKTLASIFQPGGDSVYEIPVYQRNYSWGRDQIETLFEDIKNEDKGYYVGNLLINPEEGKNNVIDGQQRLTTLSLMLLAVYENLGKFTSADTKRVDDFEDAKTDIRRHLKKNEKVRLKLLDIDQKVWENLASNILLSEEPSGYGKYTLAKRYKFVSDELIGQFENLDEILDFFGKLINIELLQIMVPDLSDAYQVFASLNSKGLPLTPLDLLKNIYLSKHGSVEKWSELKKLFENDEELNEQKLTQFVLNNYDAFHNYTTAQSLTKGKIVKKYEKVFQEQGNDYINHLISSAVIYNSISNNENSYNFGLSGLAKLDATTSYPFLLNILMRKDKLDLDDNRIKKIIATLIKLYVRRNIVLTPKASDLRSEMLKLKNQIEFQRLVGDDIVKLVEKELTRISPKDEQVRFSLENEDMYTKNKHTTRFILISLEREKGTYFNKATEDTLDEFTNKGALKWSIEHIIPQGNNLSDYWKKMLSPEDFEKANEIQKEYVHRIGNLTLTPYNSELGNKTFKEKINFTDNCAAVGLQLPLFLNSTIRIDKEEWRIEDIRSRTEKLTNEILTIFSMPRI